MLNIHNRFLRSFSLDQFDRLAPIEPVEFRANEVIFEQGEPVTQIIFMETGLVSGVRYVPEPVEMLTFGGTFGVVGAHTVLHAPASFLQYRTRVISSGWRVSAVSVHLAMAQDVAVAAHMQRIIRASNLLIAHVAACSLAHSIEQRFGRLLLQVREALDTDDIPLSRTTLAQMLRVSRGHMFASTSALAGIVTFHGNHLFIDDPAALAERACPCFEQMRRDRDRLTTDA